MERSNFIQALTSSEHLAALPIADLEKCAQEYPYASVLQLLRYKKCGKISKKQKQNLFLHFDNPLHFSVRLGKVASATATENKKAETKESSKPEIVKAKETSGKKKMRVAVPNVVSKKAAELALTEELAETSEEHNRDEALKKALAEQEKNIEDTRKLEAEEVSAKENEADNNEKIMESSEEDVLQLIQDLPEENPIPTTESQLSPEIDSGNSEKVADEEDPGDLMVMLSFTDWLQYFKAKKESEEEDKKGKDAIRSAWQKEKLAEAMDDEEDVVPDEIFEKAMKSVSFGDGLVTEPLAELYVNQGKTEKAVELYKKLSLLNPEKKVYFASRIKELHLLKE
jgi:ribosomal protein S30